jgi:hypothetical protein
MTAAAAAVRLQAMIHLHSVVPAGPFWRGTLDACEVSICAFKSLRQLDNVAWHSARWQNDLHSGESADDLTKIEAEIVLDATGNTSAIVRLLSSFGADWRQAAARPRLGLAL